MLRSWLAAFVGLCLSQLCTDVVAQEFRVYTRLQDFSDVAQGNRPTVVARSLTIWHAGKVYDVIYSAGEVTILEPAQRHIWVLNTSKNLLTSLDFDELKHLLRGAEDRLSQQIQVLDAESKASQDVIESLRRQLRPKFETSFDSRRQRLILESQQLSYEVRGQTDVRPEAVDAYLNSADWMCRLNFVLHPQPTLFPAARLELNERLRQLRLMPVEVTLRTKRDHSVSLQAEHTLSWNLNALDRQNIHHWESLLRDQKLQKVSVEEYRRTVLIQQTAKAR
jgi:hypothetical protein